MAEKNAEQVWKSVALPTYDGDVPVLERQECLGYEG